MTTRTLRWVLGLASLASFMVALDTLVVSTALTSIRQDLGASVEDLEWTVNAYNLTFAVCLLPASAIGDRYGRRRVFAAGLVAVLPRLGRLRARARRRAPSSSRAPSRASAPPSSCRSRSRSSAPRSRPSAAARRWARSRA